LVIKIFEKVLITKFSKFDEKVTSRKLNKLKTGFKKDNPHLNI
jgi:hypothetical protein